MAGISIDWRRLAGRIRRVVEGQSATDELRFIKGISKGIQEELTVATVDLGESGAIKFDDDESLYFGSDNDFEIVYDAGNNRLEIQPAGGSGIQISPAGVVTLGTALAPGSGGTGIDTSASAAGGILYTSATGTWSVLSKSADGKVLKLTAGFPAWEDDITGISFSEWSIPYGPSGGGLLTESVNFTYNATARKLLVGTTWGVSAPNDSIEAAGQIYAYALHAQNGAGGYNIGLSGVQYRVVYGDANGLYLTPPVASPSIFSIGAIGQVTINTKASSGTIPPDLKVVASAHTQVLSDNPTIDFDMSATREYRQFFIPSSVRGVMLRAPTLTANAAGQTMAYAATLELDGAPMDTPGTLDVTDLWALRVSSGKSYFNDEIRGTIFDATTVEPGGFKLAGVTVLDVSGDDTVIRPSTATQLVRIAADGGLNVLNDAETGGAKAEAANFVANSASAASTFAGDVTMDTTMFAFDQSAGNFGFGSAAPGGTDARMLFDFPTRVVAVGGSRSVFQFTPRLTEAASGTHVFLAGMRVDAFTLTAGAGSTDDAATFFVAGAPAGATRNYGAWLKGGTRIDDGFGAFGTTPTTQQASAANLTNNVTVGGTNDQIDNWTDLSTYATDAAAIRNAVYQLARKLKQVNDGLRAYGLLT